MKESIKKRIEAVRRGEVPEGYKRTDLGVMPEEWSDSTIGKVIAFHSEKSTINNEYPVLTSARSGLVLQTEYFEDQVTREENAGYNVIPYGYVTYRSRSDDGRFTFNQNQIIERGIVSCFYPVFRIIEDLAEPTFVLSYLNNHLGRQIVKEIVGTSQLVLSEKKLLELRLPCPPLAEQQKIAEILTTCDRVIELKQKLLEEKRRQKQWLLQKLLDPNSGVRIPGYAGKWKPRRLRDLGSFSKGSGISNDDCSSGDRPCIKYGDIYVAYGEHFTDAVSHTEEDVFEKAPTVSEGALLFTGSGEDPKEIGKCTVYLGNEPIAVGGDIIIMNPKRTMINPTFLAYSLNAYPAIKQKACLGQGYSIVHIYGEDIKKISVYVPPTIEEQERIAEIIKESNSSICLIEDEIAEWHQMKKALMQLLLTGLVRVNA